MTDLHGGAWANSPTVGALVEAVHFLGHRPENIDVLSIGTTRTPLTLPKSSGCACPAGMGEWSRL